MILLNTGIEEETYSADPSDLEILSAEIHKEGDPDHIWQFKVKRIQSTGIILEELDAFLSNGERIILIEGPAAIEGEEIQDSGRETTYYAFVEKGIVLARINRSVNKIAFAKETPTDNPFPSACCGYLKNSGIIIRFTDPTICPPADI